MFSWLTSFLSVSDHLRTSRTAQQSSQDAKSNELKDSEIDEEWIEVVLVPDDEWTES